MRVEIEKVMKGGKEKWWVTSNTFDYLCRKEKESPVTAAVHNPLSLILSLALSLSFSRSL